MLAMRGTLQAAGIMLLVQAAPCTLSAQTRAPTDDLVASDPPRVDSVSPAGLAELAIPSAGARMNGLFYLAAGPGPHPTVILLHGFPGNERNLDVAQAIRRAGINVLFFSYRGAWGSGGTFSFSNALEDVAAAARFVRMDESVRLYRTDPARISLVGHSMGGWLALLGAASDSSIACTGALDIWNAGADGRVFRTNEREDSLFTAYADWLTAGGGPLRAASGRVLTSELEAHADALNADGTASRLSTRPVLLISTMRNAHSASLIAALRGARARRVTALSWDSDHSFSAHRIRLARAVTDWLHQGCGW